MHKALIRTDRSEIKTLANRVIKLQKAEAGKMRELKTARSK